MQLTHFLLLFSLLAFLCRSRRRGGAQQRHPWQWCGVKIQFFCEEHPAFEPENLLALPISAISTLAADEKYISTNKFEAKNKDEIGFDKGVVVTVLEKKLDGWWRVNYQSQTGWAPGSYLKRLEVQEYQPSGVLGGTAAPVKPAKPAAVPITADGQVKLRKKDGQDKPPPQRRVSFDCRNAVADPTFLSAFHSTRYLIFLVCFLH